LGGIIVDVIVQSGLDGILLIQQYQSAELTNFFKAITLLGEEEFYLLALPVVLWCLDFSLGVRLVSLVLLSHYCNVFVKDIVREPRPFFYQPEVKLYNAAGYSFPSNHAQTGSLFWVSLAWLLHKKWLWPAAVLLALLIGLSRVYLGVHFPIDVLAGWGLGTVLLVSFIIVSPRAAPRLSRLSWSMQLILAWVVPVIMLLLNPGKESCAVAGALAGGWFGCSLRKMLLPYLPDQPGRQWFWQLVRIGVGLFSLGIIYGGLKYVFPGEHSIYYYVFRFIRYWFLALWAVAGAPWLFYQFESGNSKGQPRIPA